MAKPKPGAQRIARVSKILGIAAADRRRIDADVRLPDAAVMASARKLGINNIAELGDYATALETAALFYQADIQATPARRVRKQLQSVDDAAHLLLLAIEGCDDTTRDVLRRDLMNLNCQRSIRDITDDLSRLRISAGALAVSGREVIDTGRKLAAPAPDIEGTGKTVRVGIWPDDMPGVMSERTASGPALEQLGVTLARIYARHHVSQDFELGTEDDSANGYRFDSPAMAWFGAIVETIAPEVRSADQVSQAARAGRAALNAPKAAGN
jgi:hypothetical protein